jgi:hypothetical protein
MLYTYHIHRERRDEMEKKPCPFCGSRELEVPTGEDAQVLCAKCGCYGPWAATTRDAWELWNNRVEV